MFSCGTPKTAMEREAQKAERQLVRYQAFTDAANALADQNFIIKVDLVVFKLGQAVVTSPSTNFVSLSDTDATVQVVTDFVRGGPNFLGGITVDGRASNFTMKTDKKGNINYHMDINGFSILASVDIKLYNGDNECEVVIVPNRNQDRIVLRGNLFPESKASIFKGRSI